LFDNIRHLKVRGISEVSPSSITQACVLSGCIQTYTLIRALAGEPSSLNAVKTICLETVRLAVPIPTA